MGRGWHWAWNAPGCPFLKARTYSNTPRGTDCLGRNLYILAISVYLGPSFQYPTVTIHNVS